MAKHSLPKQRSTAARAAIVTAIAGASLALPVGSAFADNGGHHHGNGGGHRGGHSRGHGWGHGFGGWGWGSGYTVIGDGCDSTCGTSGVVYEEPVTVVAQDNCDPCASGATVVYQGVNYSNVQYVSSSYRWIPRQYVHRSGHRVWGGGFHQRLVRGGWNNC